MKYSKRLGYKNRCKRYISRLKHETEYFIAAIFGVNEINIFGGFRGLAGDMPLDYEWDETIKAWRKKS